MNDDFAARLQSIFKNTDVVVGVAIIGVIMLMIVPLSAFALDFFLVTSIMTSL